jgi:acetyl-CoA carboxylase carboxyltransferase component
MTPLILDRACLGGVMVPERELEELERRRELARQMGGEEGVAERHATGNTTVRQRIDRAVNATPRRME